MASIKLSELQIIDEVSSSDLLLITDTETSSSRKATFAALKSSTRLSELGDYADNQEDLLTAGLATGILYVKELTIGGN